jgi:hypothetical protein
VKARNEKTHAARREMNWLWMVSTNGKRPGDEGVLKEMLLQPGEAPRKTTSPPPTFPRRPPTRGRPEEDTTQRSDFSNRPPRPASPARPASRRGGGRGSATPENVSYVRQKINKEIGDKGWFTGELISENEGRTQFTVQYSEASGLRRDHVEN